MCIYIYMYLYLYIYIYTYMCMCICMCMYMYIYIYTYILLRMYACMHTCMYVLVSCQWEIHASILYIYIHIGIYIYVCVCVLKNDSLDSLYLESQWMFVANSTWQTLKARKILALWLVHRYCQPRASTLSVQCLAQQITKSTTSTEF